MTKEYFIQLTTNLYKLTLLFPKKEPLRYKVRGLADEILADLILLWQGNLVEAGEKKIQELENQLEILMSFFEVARNQNWVSPNDLLSAQEGYVKIQEELRNILEVQKNEAQGRKEGEEAGEIFDSSLLDNVSTRQKKILSLLGEKGRAQVWQLKEVFPEVTKRTLRRDMEQLLEKGLIERVGERNNTFYQLINKNS